MKKLSIIIVNYNVAYFLEQCLYSVINASKDIDREIFVVDNNSVDSSVKMLKEKFPEINLIENKENKGFSKANNQAIKLSEGEFILLLNPDTIVENDTFTKILKFIEERPDVGGLGVKMINGKGEFLPESKRGLPTPEVAFYKIFGLSVLFPKSKKFGKYHLSYLNPDEIHEVEILAGAFMFLRKSILDKIGLLDETFFMYGEDIDLSYRIIKAGFKNIYFPETRIIHYKGESTKKSSVNYVFVFYNAMIIFAKKHFSGNNARIFSVLINLAIYIRAFLSLLKRFFNNIFLPLCDALFIWGGFYLIKNYWSYYFISTDFNYYPKEYILIVVPFYILFWLFAFYLSGGYDKPFKPLKIVQGISFGTLAILVLYALLDSSLRYSRALILLGTLWAMFSLYFTRLILSFSGIKSFNFRENNIKRYVIIGEKDEADRVSELLRKTGVQTGFIGLVDISENPTKSDFIGNINQLNDIIEIYEINEVIFCAKSLSATSIINKMFDIKSKTIEYKIAPPESLYIIGSNSINTFEDIYMININAINKPQNKRNKRILDFTVSAITLIFLPLFLAIQKNPKKLISNIFNVILGKKSWVGYYNYNKENDINLPRIKEGILHTCQLIHNKNINGETIKNINLLYSRDYRPVNDLKIIFNNIRKLGT